MNNQAENFNNNLWIVNNPKFKILLFCILSSVCLTPTLASAQIIPDNTIASPSTTATVGNTTEITGGTKSGSNLFHSFTQFSVLKDTTAWFKNDVDVSNIISRVTGGSISDINGLIRANGTANLFLINPNGIVFGANAALNIGGSFVASTADSIKFADGSIYSAVNPQAAPLLTINTPIGLQYGANPGAIIVNGDGNKLFLDEFYATSRKNRPVGIAVPSGQTLALVGGEVSLVGGNVTAAQGRVEIGAVKDSLVTINSTNSGLSLSYTGVNNFLDINLTQSASIDVSGAGSGNVQVISKNVNVTDGSAILAYTEGSLNGGAIQINARESLKVNGSNPDSGLSTIISTDVSTGATGNGGIIDITTNKLIATDGGQVSSSTFGFGTGGTVNIQASDIELIFGGPLGPSGIFANTDSGSGDAGKVNVVTENLLISDGAQISTTSWFGSGKGGDINITAKKTQLIGAAFDEFASVLLATTYSNGDGGNIYLKTDNLAVKDGAQIGNNTNLGGNAGKIEVIANNIEISGTVPGKFASGLFSNVEENATGNGGLLRVETANLKLFDGGAIVSKTNGSGNAGQIEIDAKNIEIQGKEGNTLPTAIAADVQTNGTGNGGKLTINTDTLSLKDAGQIATSTFGKGDAGELIIHAKDISLDGFISSASSGIFSNASNTSNSQVISQGNGGKLTINTEKITIANGATIAASNYRSRHPNILPGDGAAGDIQINAIWLEMLNNNSEIPSSINASTWKGGGGNIQLNIQSSIMASNGSAITAETRGTANGGTIRANTNLLELNSGAFISTSSIGSGLAGDIFIDANRIRTDESQVIATSTQSGGGSIRLNSNLLLLRNNSLISSSVTDSTGGGGDIFINSRFVVGANNSDIRANAVLGNGGNIFISTNGIFLTPDSEIDASSQFGVDGVVTVTNPDADNKISIQELPQDLIDVSQQVVASCKRNRDNQFVITGRDGLPQNPTHILNSQNSWHDFRNFAVATGNNGIEAARGINKANLPENHDNATRIVEAQGWIVNANGTVELVKQALDVTYVTSQQAAPYCAGS
ncbi:filamentous hemagglutinin N-terminal domain-containing protein [Calothrix sp. FACHB-1219]|uniref:two-partner secretion domain-containing protein n=1 Tax=unclassified Calothrix TaxID=2619626 RepID=UPI00168507BF|nr:MULTISPECIES: filamentous hemagglutinin N-terminal domain-containing protein [unclassified Calothrix]MBD2203255.1 filamentous hemagglutinin N-terminal domain-containing protein [Calothrix sp. FACHB-168]MBD2216449.1 filamentous hemagglutinin N-terminal domain-containing protein [Calothrix sp. FACHB-1219]